MLVEGFRPYINGLAVCDDQVMTTTGATRPTLLPVAGTARARLVTRREITGMCSEDLLLALVGDWVAEVLPGATEAAADAAQVALRAYEGGASVSEACTEARRFVGSWYRHPSHWSMGKPSLRLVS